MTDRKFDPDWPHGHVTANGRKAEILPRRLNSPESLIVIVTNGDGSESVQTYSDSGVFDPTHPESSWNLLNVDPVVTHEMAREALTEMKRRDRAEHIFHKAALDLAQYITQQEARDGK